MAVPERRQSRRGWLIWGLLGLGIGLAGGIWWGSYLGACSGNDQCSARWDAVGAVGTWVGGLGTIAAVLIAVQAFEVEEHARRREERKAQAEAAKALALEQKAAQSVTMNAELGSYSDDEVYEVRVYLTNGSRKSSITDVTMDVAAIERSFEVREIPPGATQVFSHRPTDGPGFEPLLVGIDERPDLLFDLIDDSTVTFEMNERRWSRTGGQPVVLLS